MNRWGWAAALLTAGGVWAGCGEGGSLPGQAQDKPSVTAPDGSVGLPDIPQNQEPGNAQASTSFWPLTQGSSWTYRIKDPTKGTFDKRVEVLGEQTVPETSMKAIAVVSRQPNKDEMSWQLERDGTVVRLREEDRKQGKVTQVTTWNPATLKSLARAQPLGWSYSSDIRELTLADDGTLDDKDKTYVWRVLGVNETVTTPAGTFTNALRVERKRGDKLKPDEDRVYWLVPGVGKVRETGERLEELVSYEIKKP